MPHIVTTWDDHTSRAPHESDRWASSDRGWLFASIEMAPQELSRYGATLGHYLDYSGCASYAGRVDTVHAVSCVSRESAHFATVTEAKAFIDAAARGKVAGFLARCYLRVGGYTHRAEELARLAEVVS